MSAQHRYLSRRAFLAAATAVVGLVGCDSASEDAMQIVTASDSTTLRVGSEISFPPYEWMCDAESEFTASVEGGGFADGYDVTLAHAIAEALGKDLLFVNMPFGTLLDALNAGTVDMVISAMGDSAERSQLVAFSHSYHDSVYGLMVRGDGPFAQATELQDFAGATVLGQRNSPLDTMIDQIPEVNHLTPVEHVPEMFSQLEAGACDAITVAVETADSYLSVYSDLVLVVPENPPLDPGFTGTCVALRMDDTATMDVVNDVIDSFSRDELQRMYEEAQSRQPE